MAGYNRPTIAYFTHTGSNLILALGIGIVIFDVIHIVMLHHKFRELSLNPLLGRPSRPSAATANLDRLRKWELGFSSVPRLYI